jgi:ABC-type transport system substrate-binding protein
MLVLDPADHYSISATSVLRHIFDPLIDVTNDHKFTPALAESWEATSNTAWRFTLRKGVTFHDGTPFNADSVLYTLRRVRDNTKLIKAFVYQDLDAIEKDGEYGVTVTTKRPFGSLPAHLTMLGMLPPGAAGRLEEWDPEGRAGFLPVHPGALDPGGRPPVGRVSCHRPGAARHGADPQSQSGC